MVTNVIDKELREAKSLGEATKVLEHLLAGEYAVTPDGQLYFIRQLVAQVNGLRIEIFSREHPPPHFHVSNGRLDAVFSIISGELIEGNINGRERALVGWWFQRSQSLLIAAWNATRPSDCPVGPIEI